MSAEYSEEVKKCIEVMKNHGVILYPTDTIWGLGCDATQPKAVQRVFDIKKRDEAKTLIVLLEDVSKLSYYVDDIPPIAYDLIKQVDTPLTIIYPKARNLAPHCIAPDGHVAIRIVRNEFCNDLIREFGKPIVSTSANISGEAAPMIFQEISPEIVDQVDYAVMYRRNVLSALRPSTIIRLTGEWEYEVVRS
ncbi:MAG: threonylcarbamoyl-AMP synthase [Bacteroidetes bacterium GWF2_43_63]|nr:MAG: threonylcarbamoyl-AMP synthase [Bacteroidetes bacterium GWE2_42_42]OFY55866.1 MAG: threonylcarbamoyl-AMP synthase [Bacteroidetes bacterium GWF2_43_63]HBG69454.1 threonylcarbamoyl-AMP synthase [Bacteroidales bacterium]HCB61380.1 threonylcarbamoyl-AMP synthase [Bacteroidales bacterium]HCY24254.1 threonylcarbamoyl-AMP synthase [Bacteroidales bacterium]